MEIRGEVRLRATSQPIVHPKFTRFLPNELLCDANRVLLSCRCAFCSGLFARGFRRGTAGGMLAFARCDKAKHSRAVARLSIAVGRRLQARAALPEAGRPRRKASRPSAGGPRTAGSGRIGRKRRPGGRGARAPSLATRADSRRARGRRPRRRKARGRGRACARRVGRRSGGRGAKSVISMQKSLQFRFVLQNVYQWCLERVLVSFVLPRIARPTSRPNRQEVSFATRTTGRRADGLTRNRLS